MSIAALAAMVTCATSTIGTQVIATDPGIMGCESACLVAAGDWPLAYLVDYPGISPVGSVSLTDALLGMDTILPGKLALTFLFWFALGILGVWLVSLGNAMGRRLIQSGVLCLILGLCLMSPLTDLLPVDLSASISRPAASTYFQVVPAEEPWGATSIALIVLGLVLLCMGLLSKRRAGQQE